MRLRYIFKNTTKKMITNKIFNLKCSENELEIIENILNDVYEDLEFERKLSRSLDGRTKEVYDTAIVILNRINKIK